MDYKIRKVKPYELELTVSLDKADLEGYIFEARKNLANNLKLDGFRQGKAPMEIAKDKLNPKKVLETAFDLAFRQSFSEVLSKEKPDLIEAGKFGIKENTPEKMTYSVLLTVFPEFKLGNYKNVKVEKKAVSISDEEIDKILEFIRNSRKINGAAPEINDDFAKSLGQFNNIGELKKSIGDGLKEEKEIKETRRVQGVILDKISGDTKIKIPPILIDRQLEEMMFDLNADLQHQGVEFGLFLAKIKKTKEELIDEWRPKAEALVKKALILKEIAKKENITVKEEKVKEKADLFLKGFSSVAETEKSVDLPKLLNQIHQILLNEKVMAFLEKEAASLQ